MSRGQFQGKHPQRVVALGQSLNIVPGNLIPGTEYPARLMSGRKIPYVNLAISGAGYATLLADDAHMADVLAQARHATTCVGIMCGGSADVSSTGQAMYDMQVDYATQLLAAGYSHVINTTLVGSSTFNGTQQTNRAALNALLLGDPPAPFHSVVDLDGSDLGDWTDGALYLDGTHWLPAGALRCATLVAPTLDTILAA